MRIEHLIYEAEPPHTRAALLITLFPETEEEKVLFRKLQSETVFIEVYDEDTADERLELNI